MEDKLGGLPRGLSQILTDSHSQSIGWMTQEQAQLSNIYDAQFW